MAKYHQCTAGCGKWITYRFAICSSCEGIYGNSAKGWPDWLRVSWNLTQKERRQNRRIIQHETEAGLNDEVHDGVG